MAISTLITNLTRPALRDQGASNNTWGDTELCYAWDWAQKLFLTVAPSECTHELNAVAVAATTAVGDSGSPFFSVTLPTDFIVLRGADVRKRVTGDYYQATIHNMDGKFLEQRGSQMLAATEKDPHVFVWDKVYGAPKPEANDASGIKLWYLREPTEVNSTDDSLEIGLIYQPNLNFFVLSWAWHKVNQTQRSADEWTKGLSWLRAIGARFTDLEKLSPPWNAQRAKA